MKASLSLFGGAGLLGLMLAFVGLGEAGASSDDAWAELFAKADKACFKLAGLKAPRRIGDVLQTDDDRLAIVVVAGKSGAEGTPEVDLCIYDKATGKVTKASTNLTITVNP